MQRTLLVREILPALAWYLALTAATLLLDLLLHRLGFVGVGRWLGPLGTLLLATSFLYSLRKRRVIAWGSPKSLLTLHEVLGWAGALCLTVHSGVHLHALVPWLATASMLVVVASGFVGSVLLKRALADQKARKGEDRPPSMAVLDAVTVDAMKQWRRVHMPLNSVFLALVALHVISVLALWDW